MHDFEVVVVGAGIVGLAIAQAISETGKTVLVIEQHSRIGSEISSRNSEVVHAGLYYPPGSLRAELCVRGRELLYAFCAANGVTAKRIGKLLVATTEAEVPILHKLMTNATANGVHDLKWLAGEEGKRLEPELNCIAAVLSPSSGIVDSHGFMKALEGHITAQRGHIQLITRVVALRALESGGFEITTQEVSGLQSPITSKAVVVAAGLGATALAGTLPARGGYTVPTLYPAKGHYFSLQARAPFEHLIYPMPQGAWLGIHLTLDTAGRAKFGPDIEWVDRISYEFEDNTGERRKKFEQEIKRYWPGLPLNALIPDYTGIRPKLYSADQKVCDFMIHGAADHGYDGLVCLFGIESPGLTASLAIAENVCNRLN